MGKRARARGRVEKLTAPESEYVSAQGDVLVLRGNLLSQEDAWQRAVELLFEHLAVRWVVSDVPTEGQRELLMRFRVATQDERRWIRDVLREHVTEHFPDLEAP
jgi:hypothetical protein